MALLTFVGVASGIRPLRHILAHRAILDHPNDRSSHTVPTPKGAGLVLIPITVLSWIGASYLGFIDFPLSMIGPICGATILLMVLSWIDDLHSLHVGLRLVAHTLTAYIGLLGLPEGLYVFQGLLPPVVDQVASVFLFVWFINLFNFMDGIDGISAVETILISGGIVLVSIFVPLISVYAYYAALLFGGACGFILWNWHPARIFLGDVGSAPLGFLLGWLLLSLSAHGAWAAALILPAYYLVDSGLTLAKRIFRKERFWEAHRQHYYQQAVQRGMSHDKVVIIVFFSGLALCALAVMSIKHGAILSVALSLLTVLVVIRYFSGPPSLHRT